jgi:hypothetical protein
LDFNPICPAAITSRGTVKSFEIPQEQFALGSETGFARKQHQAPFYSSRPTDNNTHGLAFSATFTTADLKNNIMPGGGGGRCDLT